VGAAGQLISDGCWAQSGWRGMPRERIRPWYNHMSLPWRRRRIQQITVADEIDIDAPVSGASSRFWQSPIWPDSDGQMRLVGGCYSAINMRLRVHGARHLASGHLPLAHAAYLLRQSSRKARKPLGRPAGGARKAGIRARW